jgi:hydrogenase maturation protein HypF
MEKARFLISGVVQGVGFRPFCARLAMEEKLKGSVRNTNLGVELELWGERGQIDRYIRRLQRECPTAAYIQSVNPVERESDVSGSPDSFEILKSEGQSLRRVLIPPDIATCDRCLEEMRDPSDRRHRYPFINCTLCGPRFTIIQDLPYDRPKTTMSKFLMCERCSSEYRDPTNRRYHAQPNACPDCGPRLWACDRAGNPLAEGEAAIRLATELLSGGRIVAVKGLGGFHLACDARNDEAVGELRIRKHRSHRPFAIMVRDLEVAEKVAVLTEKGRGCLTSSRRPIVLCQVRMGSGLSRLLSPGLDSIGIMLPYTPLHHLLLEKLEVLVMTSANRSEEPIVAENEEALMKLSPLADAFLMHDRKICMRVDDSVVSVAGNRAFYVRRARGVVPQPLFLSKGGPSVLAAGGEMKATFSVTHEGALFPSQYLGDLKSLEGATLYREALNHFLSLYAITPEFLVTDLHPLYLSSRICREMLPNPRGVLSVQHHHAHLAACLFENGIDEPAVGLILDGTGYGTDGSIWGGEILWGDASGFERLGHLVPFTLPGGEKSIWEPWRCGMSLAYTSGLQEAAKKWAKEKKLISEDFVRSIEVSIQAGVQTTSCGRLFDGVSAMLGFADSVTYDGQAPMTLEAASRGSGALPFSVVESDGKILIDWRPAVREIVSALGRKTPASLSAAFHGGLARALVEAAAMAAERKGTRRVVLSGGVWQNRRLFSLVLGEARKRGLTPVFHTLLSPNDECVSVGQAVAGCRKWGA